MHTMRAGYLADLVRMDAGSIKPRASSQVRSLGRFGEAPVDGLETDQRRRGASLERRFAGGPYVSVSDFEGMGHAQIGADRVAIEDDETVARGGYAGGADRAPCAGGP